MDNILITLNGITYNKHVLPKNIISELKKPINESLNNAIEISEANIDFSNKEKPLLEVKKNAKKGRK